LSQATSTIEAEVRANIHELKSSKKRARPSIFPDDLEFEIFALKMAGSKPKQIIPALKDKLNQRNLDADRSRKEFIGRAIKKVENWIKEVSPE
jgi:hypothetical protein